MPLWKIDSIVHAGKIIKLHGYLGNVRVAFSFSPKQEKLASGAYLFVEWNEKPVPYLIETIQFQDNTNAIVKLADVSTEEAVQKLLKRNILLPEEFIDEAEEEEEEDSLIGFHIIDAEKKVIGEVRGLIETGPQSLLEVQSPEGKEFLIPFHGDLIKKINRRKKTIIADLPEGLLDL